MPKAPWFSPAFCGGLIEAIHHRVRTSRRAWRFPPRFAGASLKRVSMAGDHAKKHVFPRVLRGPH